MQIYTYTYKWYTNKRMLCICVFMQKTYICTYLCVYIYLFLLFFVSVSADLKAPCQSSSWHSRTLEATANVVVVPGTAVKRFATVPERTAEGRPEACKCRNTFKARNPWYFPQAVKHKLRWTKSWCQLSKDPKTCFFCRVVFWCITGISKNMWDLFKLCRKPCLTWSQQNLPWKRK